MSLVPESCEVQIIDGITHVTFNSEIVYSDCFDLLKHLNNKNIYHYRFFNFKDHPIHFSHEEVVELSAFSKALFKEVNFTCFVTSNDLTYGTLRELAVYREQEGINKMRVFRTTAEAIDWLQEQRLLSED